MFFDNRFFTSAKVGVADVVAGVFALGAFSAGVLPVADFAVAGVVVLATRLVLTAYKASFCPSGMLFNV